MSLLKNKYFYGLIFSLMAFFISSYLTILHFQNTIPPCTFSGCEVVLTSKYAEIMGIPVSLVGVLFYATTLALSTLLFSGFKTSIYKIYLLLVFSGMIISSYFLFLQAAVIKEFCQYCLVTEFCISILFLIGISDLKKIRHNTTVDETQKQK